MIKNLLNADEDPPPGTKVIIEDTVINPPPETAPPPAENTTLEKTSGNLETRREFEVPADAEFFTTPSERTDAPPERAEDSSEHVPAAENAPLNEDSESLSALMADIKNLDDKDLDLLERSLEEAAAEKAVGGQIAAPEAPKPTESEAEKPPVVAPKVVEKTDNPPTGTLFESRPEPPSMAETIRQSGLAYSAAIVLFGSVIFMMIFGWFADLLLGSSPWGIVGGIILGGIIGFIQFFRITSQIFKK